MKQVALRLDDDLAAAIDRARGEVQRETWIKARLAELVSPDDEDTFARQARAFVSHVERIKQAEARKANR